MAIDEATRNKRLWADTGTNSEVLHATALDENDLGIDDVFAEAADEFPDDEAKQSVYARVIVLRRLLAPSALQGRYVQNQSEEDLTKVFGNLERLLARWEKRVEVVSDPVEEDDTFIGGNFFGTARGRRGR
jgi:hypothetical protein